MITTHTVIQMSINVIYETLGTSARIPSNIAIRVSSEGRFMPTRAVKSDFGISILSKRIGYLKIPLLLKANILTCKLLPSVCDGEIKSPSHAIITTKALGR